MKILLSAALICLLVATVSATELPAAIKSSGALRVAIVPNYPPMEFRDTSSNELTGFDVDLGNAIGAKLGVKIDWQETAFEQMLPAVQTGRVDAIMSGMTDLASRHATASFVDYMKSGPQFFALASRAGDFKEMAAVCGKTVGTSRRTSFPGEIDKWSHAHCATNPIKVIGTEGSSDARTQLRQGRIDAAVQGSETLPYIMDQDPNTYVAIGEPFGGSQLTDMAIAKDDTVLQEAIASAVDALIADGAYKSALDKWRLSSNAIEKATINAGQ